MAKRRLFIAVLLSEETQENLAKVQSQCAKLLGLSQESFIEKKNFHLTLNFLGPVEEEKIFKLTASVKKHAELKRFEFSLNRLIAFPNAEKPSVIALSGSVGNSPLSYLQSRITMSLKDLGFPVESRVFVPHVTLFRLKKESPTKKLETLPPWTCDFQINQFALFESQTVNAKSHYTPISNWQLS